MDRDYRIAPYSGEEEARMTTIVANCPRCGANQMTFDVVADVFTNIRHGWQSTHELAVVCRQCDRLSVLKVALRDSVQKDEFQKHLVISKLSGDVGGLFAPEGFVSVADLANVKVPPEFLPQDVEQAFVEAARCMAIGCYNAAASMFRLCLDLTTKPLLPDPAEEGVSQPTREERFKLGKRIDWLIGQGMVARELSTLAHCVREDSNDGVHDGNLGQEEAADLLDFTEALLERHFTEPERLRRAEDRRTARRTPPGGEA
jgi:hypothetical protein